MKVAGRVAIVTGGGGGIGGALAEELAAHGARVVVADLTPQAPRPSPTRSTPHTRFGGRGRRGRVRHRGHPRPDRVGGKGVRTSRPVLRQRRDRRGSRPGGQRG